MSRFMMKWGPAIEALAEMARDHTPAHRADQRWATQVLLRLVGPQGFARLVMFAIDCIATLRWQPY
jgi:hypothetical protein